LDLGALVRPFGLRHRCVSDAAGWAETWSDALRRCAAGQPGALIEVQVDAPRSQKIHLGFRNLLAEHDLIG
jgi:hypothetical protein